MATTATCPPPKEKIRKPVFAFPAGTCDSHCHIFGPAERFPYAAERTYTPPDAPKEKLIALHRFLGIERAVLVQPACHGADHDAMLEAIAASGGRYRGVGLVGATTSEEDLQRLHAGGVRGARFNFVAHLGPPPEMNLLREVARRIGPLGWHIAVHMDAGDLSLLPAVLDLGLPVVIDHMARLKAAAGIEQGPFQQLLLALERDTCWIKISGADRVSAGAPYRDVLPFARALVSAAPDRVVWGTDWPHPNVTAMPDDGDIADLLPAMIPDETVRHQVLVENPARLYFGT